MDQRLNKVLLSELLHQLDTVTHAAAAAVPATADFFGKETKPVTAAAKRTGSILTLEKRGIHTDRSKYLRPMSFCGILDAVYSLSHRLRKQPMVTIFIGIQRIAHLCHYASSIKLYPEGHIKDPLILEAIHPGMLILQPKFVLLGVLTK